MQQISRCFETSFHLFNYFFFLNTHGAMRFFKFAKEKYFHTKNNQHLSHLLIHKIKDVPLSHIK